MFYPSSASYNRDTPSGSSHTKKRSPHSKTKSKSKNKPKSKTKSKSRSNELMAYYTLIQSQFNLTINPTIFKNGYKYNRENDYEQILEELGVENKTKPYPIFDFNAELINVDSISCSFTHDAQAHYNENPEVNALIYQNLIKTHMLTRDIPAMTYFQEPMVSVSIVLHPPNERTFTKFTLNESIMNAARNYNPTTVSNIHSIPLYMVVLVGGRQLASHVILIVILNKKLYTIGLGGDAILMSPDSFLILKPTRRYKILDIGVFKEEYALNLNTILSKYMDCELYVLLNPTSESSGGFGVELKNPIVMKPHAVSGKLSKKTVYAYSKYYTGYLAQPIILGPKMHDIQLINCARFVVDILTKRYKNSMLSPEYRLRCNYLDTLAFDPSNPFLCDTLPPFDERAPYIYMLIHKLRSMSTKDSSIILINLIKLLDLQDSVHYIDEV